jgi:hypothetical protein
MKFIDFASILTRRNYLLHLQAIWDESINHLKKFLDTDISPAKQGIATQGGGMVAPQSVIEEVIQFIEQNNLAVIVNELDVLLNYRIEKNVTKTSKTETQKESKSTKKKLGRPPKSKCHSK